MKQKLIVFSTGFTILSAVAFMGCSQEDGLLTGDDLSINSQVPKRRAPSEQWINTKNENPNNKFRYEEDECCLVALVETKQQDLGGNFTAGYTAQNFYDKVKGDAKKKTNEDGTPRYTGGAMDLDLFTELGKENKLFDERKNFTSDAEKKEFFSDINNKPKVMKIEVWDEEAEQMVSHIAHIKSIDRSKKTVTYNISGDVKTISINKVKAVWM